MAGVLGRLHAATAQVPADLPRKEDFALPSRAALVDALDDLDRPWLSGPFGEPARRLLEAGAHDVDRDLQEYDVLAARVREHPDAWVVTHGEPHRANVICDPLGGVHLVDWDTTLLAPRERDLRVVLDRELTGWDEYVAVAGASPRPSARVRGADGGKTSAMRYLALASSFEETIASHGQIAPATLAALRRLVASGRQLILLSRRTVEQLAGGVPPDLFACVVAEYGALLWWPATGLTRPLASPLAHPLVRELAARGLEPLSAGEVALATAPAQEAVVRQVIEAEGLDMEVVTDKDVVLAVPPGVDKATGLAAALDELGLSFHNVVGVGDAETDLAFLRRCECAVAVANAPPAVKEQCDLVVEGSDGQPVSALVEQLVTSDLAEAETHLRRHLLVLGTGEDGAVAVPAYGANVLLAGSSGTGKSKLASGLLERLTDQDYQFCVLDPEGDHADLDGAVTLGDHLEAPSVERIMAELEVPGRRVVANLLAARLESLPGFLKGLLAQLQELRTRTGRPHVLMLDEAHHFLPLPGHRGAFVVPRWVDGLIMATVNPEHVSPTALSLAATVVVFGEDAGCTLQRYCEAIGEPSPLDRAVDLEPGQALAWSRARGDKPVTFRIAAGASRRRPHLRRWAESELDEAKSFWFRGPDKRLNLRAPTLAMFIHLAEGVDDETWRHHLDQGDYSAWIRAGIRDETLAGQVAAIEREAAAYDHPVDDSRRRIFAAIRERYLAGRHE